MLANGPAAGPSRCRYDAGSVLPLDDERWRDEAKGAVPGFHLFNGDGTATEIVTFNIGGVTVLDNGVIPFQYTVNADCTGSYSLQGGLSFDLFIARDGEEFASIPTAPVGGVLTTFDRRVSRK